MIEVHDPLRLLVIVEHHPDIVLATIQKNPATYEWFANEWVNLVAFDSENNGFFIFSDDTFKPYNLLDYSICKVAGIESVIESSHENLPVFELNN